MLVQTTIPVSRMCNNTGFLYWTLGGGFIDKQVETAVLGLADLFNRTASRLLLETSIHTAINVRRLSLNKHPLLSIQRYSVIQFSELKKLCIDLLKVRHCNTCEAWFF